MNESMILALLLLLPLHSMAEIETDSVDVARNSIFDPPQEEQVFFYHKDHLGSTLCITDRNGQIVERAEYIPYGEVFVDNIASDAEYETPYKFTGKEYDDETGLYYFGTRYLHPKYATWLSVDPLATKYPNVSPYVYCHGNPISWIDPDGKDDYKMDKWGYLTFWRKTDGTTDRIYATNGQNMPISKDLRKQLMTERDDYNGNYAVGSKNMGKLFLFVANNTNVEWSIVSVKTKDGNRDILSTSHKTDGVSVLDKKNENIPGGFSILDMTTQTHSHADENMNPSGFKPSDSRTNTKGQLVLIAPSDRATADDIITIFQKAGKRAPTFYMYHAPSKKGVRYDADEIYK